MSKTYEKDSRERKRHNSFKDNWNLCLWVLKITCGLFPFITLDLTQLQDKWRCLHFLYRVSLSQWHLPPLLFFSFKTRFYRDDRDVQRSLGVVQPVCRLGPSLQSWRGRQNWRRARTTKCVAPPRRHGDVFWRGFTVVNGYTSHVAATVTKKNSHTTHIEDVMVSTTYWLKEQNLLFWSVISYFNTFFKQRSQIFDHHMWELAAFIIAIYDNKLNIFWVFHFLLNETSYILHFYFICDTFFSIFWGFIWQFWAVQRGMTYNKRVYRWIWTVNVKINVVCILSSRLCSLYDQLKEHNNWQIHWYWQLFTTLNWIFFLVVTIYY